MKHVISENTNPQKTGFITAYSPKLKIQIHFTGPGRTKQSFKNECDINTIMRRYQSTGVLPNMLNQGNAQYLDVTGLDYQEMMQTVSGANSLFQELPSSIRSRFKNDPAAFLDFTNDPNNRLELAEMGLLSPQAMQDIANSQSVKQTAPAASPEAAPAETV